VALLGEPAEADTQTLINTVYAAYLPNKVVAGCAPDDEDDAELIPLLANRPTRDGRVIAYACEGYACQTPTTDPERLARQFGISQISADWRGTFHFGRRCQARVHPRTVTCDRDLPGIDLRSQEAGSRKKNPP
jgi:hypothetical protein